MTISRAVHFLFFGIIFLSLTHTVSAGSIVWERTLAGTGGAGVAITDITNPENVFMARGDYWYRYDKDGNQIDIFNLGGSTNEVDISGNYYYVSLWSNSMSAKKVDTAGLVVDTYTYSTSTWSSTRMVGIAVDSSENIYLAGLASVGSKTDWLVSKFDPSGNFQWLDHQSEGATTVSAAREAGVVGNSLYVYGARQLGNGTLYAKAKKYDISGSIPSIVVSDNSIDSAVIGSELRIYNNQPYMLRGIGALYSINTSDLVPSLLASSIPVAYPTPGYECDNIYNGDSSMISSSGIAWTVGTCQTSPNYKHYVNRFNLNTLQVSGPHYIGDFELTHSYPTEPGGAVFSENQNIVYVTGAKSNPSYLSPAIWRYSIATCNGPLSFDAWTDNPLSVGMSVKDDHLIELRGAIDELRLDAGTSTYSWTDSNLQGLSIKAIHINELRRALEGVYGLCGQGALSWTDGSSVVSGVTPIRAQHIIELRQRTESAL